MAVNPRRKPGASRAAILGLVAVALVAGLAALVFFPSPEPGPPPPESATTAEGQATPGSSPVTGGPATVPATVPAPPSAAASGQPTPPAAAIPGQTPPPGGAPPAMPQPPAASPAVSGPAAAGHTAQAVREPPLLAPAAKDRCRSLVAEVNDLFTYLQDQPYLAQYDDGQPLGRRFAAMAQQLADQPPMVVDEAQDLFTIAKNTAHLYRVLGPRNLALLRDILREESGRLEHDAAFLFPFFKEGCRTADGFAFPLDRAYDYASFFLTTVGGRSYLFRRTPEIRFLAEYYSLLLVDAANDRGRNRFGVLVTDHLDTAFADLAAATGLEDRDEYRQVLEELAAKYRHVPQP